MCYEVPRNVPRLAQIVAIALLLGGCSKERPAGPGPTPVPSASAAASTAPVKPQGPRLQRPYNVMLILIEALRADMPWAGYPRKIAPHLTEIEKQSVSYTRAYAVASYTAKSIAALLSGQYPSSLKRSGYFFTRYPDSNTAFVRRHAYGNRRNDGADRAGGRQAMDRHRLRRRTR